MGVIDMVDGKLYVRKRDGSQQPVHFDKITTRLQTLVEIEPKLDQDVDATVIAQKVVAGIFPGVETTALDELASETAAYHATLHPDYSILAARICISNLHKQTNPSFSQTIDMIYRSVHPKTNKPLQLISDEVYNIVMKNAERLDSAIDYNRDYDYDFFGYKTLERSYLIKLNGNTVERPQHLLMRCAIGIHSTDISAALETYYYMSKKMFIHATPTLYNAGNTHPQMSSCFLLQMKEDSISGIYETLKQCALISKNAGGIGIALHNIRATNSHIHGTNGKSNGLIPLIRVYNDTARYVDQGGGKRKGAFAMYLEPWHADIFKFLELKRNNGSEENRARDLFYALWVPDLFMKRVEENGNWSLFCPNEAPGLADCWGTEFDALYCKYESTPNLPRRTFPARILWDAILESQTETGTPYMLYKDSCNSKSNQKNLGCIWCSNLCTEIIQYTSPEEVACCNLASIALPKYIQDGKFDHEKLAFVVKILVRNLNKIIDRNYYPIPEAKNSNLRHRPISIGIQGLADVFIALRYPFESKEAKILNIQISETIYFAALSESMRLAQKYGPYSSYQGSPASQGILQYDMWNVKPSDMWDWKQLKENIALHGLRNSLLIGPMPTASTSQILGNNECFEPYTSNIFTRMLVIEQFDEILHIYHRRVIAGEFTIINRQLVADLKSLGLWSVSMKNQIIKKRGSIQDIDTIPESLKCLYKTVWEIKQRTLIDMAADRGAFIDQSQSFNVFMSDPTPAKLSSMHFYGWKKGLKTGMYYLRSKAAADADQVTIDQTQRQLRNQISVLDPAHLEITLLFLTLSLSLPWIPTILLVPATKIVCLAAVDFKEISF